MRFLNICAALAIFFSANATANPLIEQLIGATTAFLEKEIEQHLDQSSRDARHSISVNRLDSRLRLTPCPENSLRATLESPAVPVGRVTVRLACESEHVRWRLFVPAEVNLYQPVVVVTRALGRHDAINAEDLTLLERDVGQLNGGYLTELDQAIGMRTRRSMREDTVLNPNHLELDEIVKRGDRVIISAANSQISVRMPGEALEGGVIDSQIRVRNSRSGRTVTARITAPGQVEVAL
ncbi:flagellar basal body P-ring formation chaperone FlgA [Halopseudomonas salegens]|uniref:Flagella basal body P-ring formation protein FlgA n=1 Tax=Halopseudomonas salegens TaxID=1434072 RepID=A0A1H2GD00_9GAMM|nr:flagellar basal body P-ring formation chaperone FlgA [Halopseudomonas salegens]SDU17435.1 flagella basal body P-ring formation protein FlgA [Halopseudomonas salegens]